MSIFWSSVIYAVFHKPSVLFPKLNDTENMFVLHMHAAVHNTDPDFVLWTTVYKDKEHALWNNVFSEIWHILCLERSLISLVIWGVGIEMCLEISHWKCEVPSSNLIWRMNIYTECLFNHSSVKTFLIKRFYYICYQVDSSSNSMVPWFTYLKKDIRMKRQARRLQQSSHHQYIPCSFFVGANKPSMFCY